MIQEIEVFLKKYNIDFNVFLFKIKLIYFSLIFFMKKLHSLILSWATALSLSWCFGSSVVNSVKDDIETLTVKWDNILNLSSKEKKNRINRTIQLIWKNEYNFFIDFFKIDSNDEFINTVYYIQSKNNLNKDWIIWDSTLEIIYLKYYKNSQINDFNVNKRLKIHQDLKWYNNHPWKHTRYWKIKAWYVPSTFSKNYFYWIWMSENIEWTYINKSLKPLIYDKINRWWNVAVLQHLNWKYFVALYVDNDLELLSYVSPWTSRIEWWIKTKKWKFKVRRSSKYHISWARDSIYRDNDWILKWAVMPFALHVVWWIYFHAWYVTWTRKSHWCIRLPLFYANWMYEIFKENWNIDIFVVDN